MFLRGGLSLLREPAKGTPNSGSSGKARGSGVPGGVGLERWWEGRGPHPPGVGPRARSSPPLPVRGPAGARRWSVPAQSPPKTRVAAPCSSPWAHRVGVPTPGPRKCPLAAYPSAARSLRPLPVTPAFGLSPGTFWKAKTKWEPFPRPALRHWSGYLRGDPPVGVGRTPEWAQTSG